MKLFPTNADDILDSRDIIARIEELTEEIHEFECAGLDEDDYADERDDLESLTALQEEAEGYSEDWQYGATLIRDSHFETYAQELAEEIGAIDSDAPWPANCIDWQVAADQLKLDYTSVDFDGVTYWVR